MLLHIDGFEQFGGESDTLDLSAAYAESNTGFKIGTAGRFGGTALKFTGSRSFTTRSLGESSTWIVGFSFKRPTSGSYTICTVMEDGGLTDGVNVVANADLTLTVRRGGNTLGTSGIVLTADTWAYVELRVTIHNSTGSYELRVNGVDVLSDSGVDTQAGSNGNADRIKFGGTSNAEFDDVYVCDSSGATNNDFLGIQKVSTLFPNAPGDETDFTPSAGANWQAVDDVPADGDSTYVESDTPGDTDLYDIQDVASLGSIKGIMVAAVVRKTDTPDFDLLLPVKSGTTQDDGAAQVVDHSDYLTHSRVVETDPDTSSAWTASGINSLQAGVKIDDA